MIDSPVFIDVNVPMYAAGQEHENKASCSWVMSAIARGDLFGVIDVEIIQEVLHRYGSLGAWAVGHRMSDNLLDIMHDVLPITVGDIEQTVVLASTYGVKYHIPARDLIHAAVMRNNRLSTIVSTDKHFDQLGSITRIHPKQLMNEAKSS